MRHAGSAPNAVGSAGHNRGAQPCYSANHGSQDHISKATVRSIASGKVGQQSSEQMQIVDTDDMRLASIAMVAQCCNCIWDWAKCLHGMPHCSKHACSGLRRSLMPVMVAATKGVGMTMRSSSACLTTSAMSVLALKPSGALCPCIAVAMLHHLG